MMPTTLSVAMAMGDATQQRHRHPLRNGEGELDFGHLSNESQWSLMVKRVFFSMGLCILWPDT